MSKSNHRNRSTFLRRRKAGKSKMKAPARVGVLRIHHLTIDARKLRQATAFLKQSGVRNYVSAFLKGELKVVVCVNPFSQEELRKWRTLQTLFGQR